MRNKNKIIGIDLGITNSVVSVLGNSKTMNKDGDYNMGIFPDKLLDQDQSALYLSPGFICKHQAVTYPENTLYDVKRLWPIKSNENESLSKTAKIAVDNIDKDDNGEACEAAKANLVLDYIKAITVPAHFTDSQRQAIKGAGEIAGLNELRIINEPTAASLAYGLDKFNGDSVFTAMPCFEDKLSKSPRLKEAAEKAKIEPSLSQKSDIGLPNITADATGPKHLNHKKLLSFMANSLIEHASIKKVVIAPQYEDFNQLDSGAKQEISEPHHKQAEANKAFSHFRWISDNESSMIKDFKLSPEKPQNELGNKFSSWNEPSASLTMTPVRLFMAENFESRLQQLNSQLPEMFELIDLHENMGVQLSTKQALQNPYLIGDDTAIPEDDPEPFKSEIWFNRNPDLAQLLIALQADDTLPSIVWELKAPESVVKDVLLLDVTPLSLGIETLGGVMTKLIDKNTTIPTTATQVFSTAEDNQTAVTVHVLQGEREIASANKSLGRFDLSDIPPAQRGTPQIKVTFDIDANGIMNVSAKDKATGKEQSIVIKASSGLSDDEIEKMVRDAEDHKDQDCKFQELVQVRNQADSMIHATEKSLSDLGDKVEAEEKTTIETAITDLKEALKGDDTTIEDDPDQLESELWLNRNPGLPQSPIALQAELNEHTSSPSTEKNHVEEILFTREKIIMNSALSVHQEIDEGSNFAIREGGRTVGAGVVSKIEEEKRKQSIDLEEDGVPQTKAISSLVDDFNYAKVAPQKSDPFLEQINESLACPNFDFFKITHPENVSYFRTWDLLLEKGLQSEPYESLDLGINSWFDFGSWAANVPDALDSHDDWMDGLESLSQP